MCAPVANAELYTATYSFIESKLGCFSPKLFPIDYNAVYGAMAQVTGVLLALVGILVLYRLGAQRERVENRLLYLKDSAKDQALTLPRGTGIKEIVEASEKIIKTRPDAVKIKKYYLDLKKVTGRYHYTARRGMVSIFALSVLFAVYVAGLYIHPMLAFPQLFFYGTLLMSLTTVLLISAFIYRLLTDEQSEFNVRFKHLK